MHQQDIEEIKKRVDLVVASYWGHITPGTPAGDNIEAFKRHLHEAISPTLAQPIASANIKSNIHMEG